MRTNFNSSGIEKIKTPSDSQCKAKSYAIGIAFAILSASRRALHPAYALLVVGLLASTAPASPCAI